MWQEGRLGQVCPLEPRGLQGVKKKDGLKGKTGDGSGKTKRVKEKADRDYD